MDGVARSPEKDVQWAKPMEQVCVVPKALMIVMISRTTQENAKNVIYLARPVLEPCLISVSPVLHLLGA